MVREGLIAAVKAAPLGDGHPEIKIPGPPDGRFYNGLVTPSM
jgi:hypothetical protein